MKRRPVLTHCLILLLVSKCFRRKRISNVRFLLFNVRLFRFFKCSTYVQCPVMKSMFLVQQQIPQKKFHVLRCFTDAVFQIIIVSPYKGVSEVPCIIGKNVVGHIKSKCSHVLDEEHCCCSGVALSEYVNLQKSRNENRKVMDDLIHRKILTGKFLSSCTG